MSASGDWTPAQADLDGLIQLLRDSTSTVSAIQSNVLKVRPPGPVQWSFPGVILCSEPLNSLVLNPLRNHSNWTRMHKSQTTTTIWRTSSLF